MQIDAAMPPLFPTVKGGVAQAVLPAAKNMIAGGNHPMFQGGQGGQHFHGGSGGVFARNRLVNQGVERIVVQAAPQIDRNAARKAIGVIGGGGDQGINRTGVGVHHHHAAAFAAQPFVNKALQLPIQVQRQILAIGGGIVGDFADGAAMGIHLNMAKAGTPAQPQLILLFYPRLANGKVGQQQGGIILGMDLPLRILLGGFFVGLGLRLTQRADIAGHMRRRLRQWIGTVLPLLNLCPA